MRGRSERQCYQVSTGAVVSTGLLQMDDDKSYPFISKAKCSVSKRDPNHSFFAEAITETTLAVFGAPA